MANKNIPPTYQTIAAADNFADWLTENMTRNRVTCDRLASAIGCERKAIIAYRTAQTSPRLDALAAIFNFFGADRISIPLIKKED